jgi:hypothetical protein
MRCFNSLFSQPLVKTDRSNADPSKPGDLVDSTCASDEINVLLYRFFNGSGIVMIIYNKTFYEEADLVP